MAAYLIRRVLLFIPTLWVAITLVFVIFRLIPGDPAQLAAGESASEEVVETIRRDMGLDKPIAVQYVRYLGDLLQGDLGHSRVYQGGVGDEILNRLPATLKLALAAMLIATVVGVTLGIISAIRPSSWLDYLSMVTAVGGVSLPAFWLGLMLIIVFSVKLDLFPVAGYNQQSAIVLPAVTLAAHQMAVLARITRSSMLGVLSQDYMRTARAKGLHERPVILRHALRNALIPTITIAGMQLGYLLGGSLVVETVFAWPGLGRLMIDSIQLRDYTMIQAIVLVFAVLMLLVNLLVDLLYSVIDPRVSYG
jgi:ABC-type dipeptide/oligopeptide/nickel transport system permease component